MNRKNVRTAPREQDPDFYDQLIKPRRSRVITQNPEASWKQPIPFDGYARTHRTRADMETPFGNVATAIEQIVDMTTACNKTEPCYLAEAFRLMIANRTGTVQADREAARPALGIDLAELTGKIEAKADRNTIETAIETAVRDKIDKTGLEILRQALEEEIAKSRTPIGTIVIFTASEAPAGYLKADGSAVGRQTCPDLSVAIGTAYGEGNGETTFNLPDLTDRFLQCSATPGQYIEAGLPDITGNTVSGLQYPSSFGDAFTSLGNAGSKAPNADSGGTSLDFDASRSNPIYGASHTVQPPASTLRPCVRAFHP